MLVKFLKSKSMVDINSISLHRTMAQNTSTKKPRQCFVNKAAGDDPSFLPLCVAFDIVSDLPNKALLKHKYKHQDKYTKNSDQILF
jgi:hypothetical protein